MRRSSAPIVVLSERLGPVGADERTLESAGALLRSAPLWSPEAFAANATDATVVVVGAVEPVDAAVLESLPQCVAVVRRGVGHDNVDVDAATRLGILVANVPDASVEEVSDHALALLLCVERHISTLDGAVRAGLWRADPHAIMAARNGMRRMSELTLGIVGFGRIGRALARKAAPLYRAVLAADPALSSDEIRRAGAEPSTVDGVLTGADHISLHAPLGAQTRHLVDAELLSRLRPGAVLVNTARGGMVDETALVEAVRAGRLGGAALDVTEHEPLRDGDPLLSEERILLTAHSAAFSATSAAELRQRAVAAVADVLADRVPASVVNPEVLTTPDLRAKWLRHDG